MNRKGSLVKGTLVAVMLSTGFTAAIAAVGARTANAASLQDQQLELNLASESFRVDWNTKPDGYGSTQITGYVYSNKGRAADQVQLRATYFKTMLEEVPAEGRAYFDVKVPANGQASAYQVGVYSWNDIEGGTN